MLGTGTIFESPAPVAGKYPNHTVTKWFMVEWALGPTQRFLGVCARRYLPDL